VRFGVSVPAAGREVPGSDLLGLARAVEELGFDSLWAADHPMFATDCWTTLAAFATVTRRVRLGPLVACVFYRSTVALARAAADVDRLSGGRLLLGIGTGSLLPEFPLIGLPLPSNSDRRRALDGALAELSRLWHDNPAEVVQTGSGLSIEGSALNWRPVQAPRVPLLIAGGGEQVTLRRVAEHADMCNLLDRTCSTAADVAQKFEALRRHCDAVGRDYDAILRSHTINPLVLASDAGRLQAKVESLPAWMQAMPRLRALTPPQLVAHYRPMIAAGVQYIVPFLAQWDDLETLELLNREVVPQLEQAAP